MSERSELAPCICIIGASLSEPRIDEKYMRESYIYIYGTSVTRAPPYAKPIGRMKYLEMISPRQKKINCGPRGRM